jgi:hypothetical protein
MVALGGERRYSSYSFKTSALDENAQRHAPATLYPGKRTHVTHCTGGWVEPRAGLGSEAGERILCPGDRIPIAQTSSP